MPETIWSRPYRCPQRLSRQSTVLSPSTTLKGPSTSGNGTEASRGCLATAATVRTANDPVRKHHVALVADEARIRQTCRARRLILGTQTDRRGARRFAWINGCNAGNRLGDLSNLRSSKLAAAS